MAEEPESQEEGNGRNIFSNEISMIEEIIDTFQAGNLTNIALITDPFAGQDIIIGDIREKYGDNVSHYPFFSVVTGKDFLANLYQAKDIVLIENCHFLALRKIGGFEILDAFLDFLSTSDKLFITTWNSYTWSYLDAVRNISAFFPETVKIPRIDGGLLKDLVRSRYQGEIVYIDDTPLEERRILRIRHRKTVIPFSTRSFDLPYPEFTLGGPDERKSPEEVALGKIVRIADGNPGIALKIWERTLENNTLKVSAIPDLPCSIELDINESFLLAIILSMESIKLIDLAEIAGPEIDIEQTLYRLLNQGLVEEERGFYHIRPVALNCTIAYLKKKRVVW